MNSDNLHNNLCNWGGHSKLVNHPYSFILPFTASWKEILAFIFPLFCIWSSFGSCTTLVRNQMARSICYFVVIFITYNCNKGIGETNQGLIKTWASF